MCMYYHRHNLSYVILVVSQGCPRNRKFKKGIFSSLLVGAILWGEEEDGRRRWVVIMLHLVLNREVSKGFLDANAK